jgi:hypothetical protein
MVRDGLTEVTSGVSELANYDTLWPVVENAWRSRYGCYDRGVIAAITRYLADGVYADGNGDDYPSWGPKLDYACSVFRRSTLERN